MTVKVELGGTVYFVYNVRDRYEANFLANIVRQRVSRGCKTNTIQAYKYYDTDYTYYFKKRFNGDTEIRIKE